MSLSFPQKEPGRRPEPKGDHYRHRRKATLSAAEEAMLELISNLSQRWGVCKAGEAWLANELHITSRYVRTLINRLHQKGCLAITPRPGFSNLLRVLKFKPDEPDQPAPALSTADVFRPTPRPERPMKSAQKRGSDTESPRNNCSTHPGTTVPDSKGGTTVPPTKVHTPTLGASDEAPLFAGGWFNPWELAPGAISRVQDELEKCFSQGGARFCHYLGRHPDYLSCRSVRTVLSLTAGQHVVFLKLAIEGSEKVEEVTIKTKAMAAWRFR